MIKRLVKSILKAAAPQKYDSVMATRENNHGKRIMESFGVPEIAAAMTGRYGLTVQSGPFKGMEYIEGSAGSAFLPKIIGSYECELARAVEQILKTTYATVVDVGSAEGYYAVGFAMHLPGAPKVYAFDINPDAQAQCRELARKNQMESRISVDGFCDPARLQSTLKDRSLVICDCEGYEVEVLQPSRTPALAQADLLVELHDLVRAGVTPILMERFAPTHDIQLIDSAERNPADYPEVQFLSPQQQKTALSEFRNAPQQWAFMTPKSA